jgi:hypothetical protein
MPGDAGAWLEPRSDGAVLRVHVVPGARESGVAGVHGDAIRVRVAAVPERGAANRELLRVLAEALGVRPAALSVESGARGRRKRVRVRGITAETVRAWIAGRGFVDTAGGDG